MLDSFTRADSQQSSAIKTVHEDVVPVTLPQDVQAQAQACWESLLVSRPGLTNGRLLRVHEYDEQVVTVVPDVDYKTITGLRYNSAPTPPPFVVLTAIAVVLTVDDHVVLQVRDSGDWPRSLECPGGFVRYPEHKSVETVSDFIQQKVHAEVRQNSEALQFLGTYQAHSILEHMQVFVSTLTVESTVFAFDERFECIPLVELQQYLDGVYELRTAFHRPSFAVLQYFLEHFKQ